MTCSRLLFTLLLFLFGTSLVVAENPEKIKLPKKLPLSGYSPSKIMPNLCLVKYRISTRSPKCQAYFDQGLGWLYSYVWMEAARSFETAVLHDPECPMAWWGLSRALERNRKKSAHIKALKNALKFIDRGSNREQMLIKARLQIKGLWEDLKEKNKDKTERKKAAIQTVDEMLALFEDDEEAWIARAALANDFRVHGGRVAGVPFYKALLHVNPLHPAANHELVHFYEGFRRPALGWAHAEKYLQSSPRIPHAWHMQAHLAMRLGRWDKTSDRSAEAVKLEREYHKIMGVEPKKDYQFSHHLEILMISLIHDGRFEEAEKLKRECLKYGYKHRIPWFRLAMAQRRYEEALEIADQYYKRDKITRSYLRALVYFAKEDTARAIPEVDVLQTAYPKRKKKDRRIEKRLWETQGILMCRQGEPEYGLKMLKKLVDWSKDDYRSHAWGGGAYFMIIWGNEALRAQKLDIAEEAYLEAIAHDPRSVHGALGMQVLCEQQGRTEEAARFAELAQRCWNRADSGDLLRELHALREVTEPAVESKTAVEN